jgi:hypothetical protein
MKRSILIVAMWLMMFSVTAMSQTVAFTPELWDIQAKESRVEDHLGRKSLYLQAGLASVKDSKFTDGVIEFDIAFTGERGFMGVVWRMQDPENYEEFYLRPHQSGNPDANQYQGVFNGLAAWQLYYGEEYSAPVKYSFNQWIHIKIVVAGNNAEIYINDMSTPALFINELKRETKQGRVGLSVGNFAPAHFSNFSFNTQTPVLKGKPKKADPPPAGMVMSWNVSNTFDEKVLENKYQLTASDEEKLTWTRLSCENSGIANLARLHGLTKGNTVFARLKISSDKDQVKKVRFGFSDNVKVYLNRTLLYGGSDIYRSRDYRFLGTVGLFDELYLPLKRGENELWMAVTENFGGWGIKAMLDNQDGIRILD